MEDEERKAMVQKFDEDLRFCFQEEFEKQKLKEAQELHQQEERKLEDAVKQLSAEHGISEEDIWIQMQLVQHIVKAEVEKNMESDRKEEEEERGDAPQKRKKRGRRKEEVRGDGQRKRTTGMGTIGMNRRSWL